MVVQCPQCRARFNAPDEFAGRKVRCRKCQAIIAVPFARAKAGGNGKDVLYADELESLDDKDFQGGGGGDRRGGVARLDLVDPDELFQQASAEFEAPRSNALYFYPLSGQVDRWLPVLLVLPALVWLCSQAFTTASAVSMPGWVGPVRLMLILGGFLVFVLPATYIAVRSAARRLNYRLPAWAVWRVGAVFSLPYILAAAMWLIAGQTSDYFTGLVVGLLMALPALWLLLRLDPEEGPVTLSLAGGAFAASTAAVIGLALLFANLVNGSVDPANKPTAMRENPLGPGLRWDRPPDKPAPKPGVVRNTGPTTPAGTQAVAVTTDPLGTGTPPLIPATTTTPTTQAIATNTTPGPWTPGPFSATQAVAAATQQSVIPIVPQPLPPTTMATTPTDPPKTNDPLAGTLPPLASSLREGFTGRFEALLSAPAPRSYVAVLARSAEGQPVVTRWDLADWRPAGEVTFTGRAPDYHVSPDGALVARLTAFPSLSVQVYSFLERKFRDPVKLDETQGEPSILGFAGPTSLLIHWRRAEDGSSALEVVDTMAGRWLKRIPRIGNFDGHPAHYAISDDGRVAAFFTRDGIAADAPAFVEVLALTLTDKLTQRIPVTQLTWSGRVRVPGVALSPERDEVSLLLEDEGQGLFLAWDVAAAKLTRQHLAPNGLVPPTININQFEGNALNYLDGTRAWLVYGCSIYDTAKGHRLGTLDLGLPMRQWVSGEMCYVYRYNDRSLCVLNAVKINVEKLRGMLKE